MFGLLIAWILVRYEFPGKKLIDAAVDLPFALPTAVAGIALVSLYSENGWVGSLLTPLGVKVAYTPLGVTIALFSLACPSLFVRFNRYLPIWTRCRRGCRHARRFPPADLRPGDPARHCPSLADRLRARLCAGVGEYGSIIFIAGNMPFKSEIAPLLIITQLEQFDYDGATAIACVMLVLSFAMLLFVNLLQAWRAKRGTR